MQFKRRLRAQCCNCLAFWITAGRPDKWHFGWQDGKLVPGGIAGGSTCSPTIADWMDFSLEVMGNVEYILLENGRILLENRQISLENGHKSLENSSVSRLFQKRQTAKIENTCQRIRTLNTYKFDKCPTKCWKSRVFLTYFFLFTSKLP